jgi:hypothetical protein
VAIVRSRIALAVRLAILAPVALIGLGGAGLPLPVALAVVGVVAVLLVSGYRARTVVGLLAVLPAGFVVFGVLTSDLPLWQRLAGAAAYPMVLAPILLWFSRAVAPFPSER